jgi:heme/copper-type cytochrome/quinol oxidase subunit 3
VSASSKDVLVAPPAAARAADTAWLGMVLFLGSWVMLFSALLFADTALRLQQPPWPPPGVQLPRLLPALATAVLSLSAAALGRALGAARRGQARSLRGGLSLAVLLGSGFLLLQGLLWTSLRRAGLSFRDGTLGALALGLLAFHALHVLVGLQGLARLLPAANLAGLGTLRDGRFRLWALYWHVVGGAWLPLYLLLFVV